MQLSDPDSTLGRRWRQAGVCTAALILSACAHSPASQPVQLSSRSAQQAVEEIVRPASIWLLGELHDSPDGHLRRWLDLSQRVQAGWRPALVMEHFDRERQVDLDAAMAQCSDADCVVQRAGGKGWDWPLLAPVLELALRHRLPVVAANVSRTDASRVVREGLSAAMAPDWMQRFGLPGSLTPEVKAVLEQAVDQGHCGQLPPALVPRMAQAQMARDMWMAGQLQEHAARGAVLLAGNGHVRRSAGVPHWLRQLGLQDVQVVGYEEEGAEVRPGEYDQLRRVPVYPRPDPCADWRKGAGSGG